jgi:putative membrane protein
MRARSVSAWDEEWLMTSIQGDRFEIAGGKIVRTNSGNPQIRALGIEVPETPTPSEQWKLKVVGRMTDTDFDKSYADLEVFDHKQDIKESKDEAAPRPPRSGAGRGSTARRSA